MGVFFQAAPCRSLTERYEALFRLSQGLRSNCCSDELMNVLVRELREVVDFHFIGIGTFEAQARETCIKCFDQAGAPIEVPKLAPEESLAWWVYQNQQPLVIPDVDEETRFPLVLRVLKERGIRSACTLPLTTVQRRLGGLALGSTEPDAYGSEEVSFLALVANQVALAVDAALSFDESQQARRELERKHAELQSEHDRLTLLLDVTNQVVSNLEFREILPAISASLRRVMHCDKATVWLLDPEGKRLRAYAENFPEGKGLPREALSIAVDEDSPAAGPRWVAGVVRTGQPRRIKASDVAQLNPSDSLAAPGGMRSGCLLPLVSRNRTLGVLGLGRREDRPFSQDDVDFLSQVASQVAIAVENANAYRQIADLKDKLAQEKLYLEDEIRSELNFEHIVGKGAALRRVLQHVETVASTGSTVLIHGETGTGKELIARAIHDRSPRRGRSFVKLNCAAIPTGLLESELFGHEKGAFTGAITQRVGRFELANAGTIFLDEIGEIPLELQPKLLRVLQEREFERLGSSRTLRTDARLIAATNRDLAVMVEEGTFRPDLFYRLNVFPVQVPPLRERSEDIPLLVRHFAQEFSRRMNKRVETIPSETLQALTRYHWPGNIRELQNVIERAVIVSTGPVLRVALNETKHPGANGKAGPSSHDTLEEAERKHILRALDDTSWVLAGPQGAAVRLGMKRSTLQYRMAKLGILRPLQAPSRPFATPAGQ